MGSVNKEIIYEKVLKYLSLLKNGKTIKTSTMLLDLKDTMEKLNEILYEERKKRWKVKYWVLKL